MSSNLQETPSRDSPRRRTTQSHEHRPDKFSLVEPGGSEVPRNWFKFMLSHPLQKHMSVIEVFTLWSALLLYFPLGMLSMCDPQIPGKIFGLTTGKYGDGIARISGIQTVVIAFLYFIFSRASPSISSNCIILATVIERILIVNALLFLIFWQHHLPVQFLLSIMVMDTGLSIITIALWFHESKVASVGKFFSNVSQVMFFSQPSCFTSRVVQWLGFVQMLLGCTFAAFPKLSNQLLHLSASDLDDHSQGLLSVCHFLSVAVGCIHFFSGGANSKAYNTASVFYRMIFSIPLLIFFWLSSQIPFTLMGYFVCLDAVSMLVIFLSLNIENVN